MGSPVLDTRFWRPVLYQLSYAPRRAVCSRGLRNPWPRTSSLARMRNPVGLLFLFIAAVFAGIAYAAARAEQWVILLAAAALAAWMFGLAFRALARR